MITLFIMWLFSLPRKIINLLKKGYKKIVYIFQYLFVPDKKKKKKYTSRK